MFTEVIDPLSCLLDLMRNLVKVQVKGFVPPGFTTHLHLICSSGQNQSLMSAKSQKDRPIKLGTFWNY